jgi:nicotinamide-nucleotide amidase
MDELQSLAHQLGEHLVRAGARLATAESCTGGWVAKLVTVIPGSSAWLDRGFVTYSNRSKSDMLGVRAETLARFGAVSEETVREMAEGALDRSQADVSVAISGIAGPGGATPDKPLGTVWVAWGREGGGTLARVFHFAGDRDSVRRQAVRAALDGLMSILG